MDDNFILPFQLESSLIRGRIVRMGSVLNDILSAHDYPADALHLTGEVAVLCAMLSSMLKYDGIFTLQVKGEGPVTMLVSDMTSEGGIRACASFKADDLARATFKNNRAELLGEGHMAFTVDQGENTERYQGIVELKPESLIGSVQHYFIQSEQISTGMVMAVGRTKDGQWRGSGIMLQKMPEHGGVARDKSNVDEDDWRRTMILLGSTKDEELISPDLSARDLLFRLFHEEGVRIFEPQGLEKTCRCNERRVETILEGMSDEDLAEMTQDGKITMTCEFCSRTYVYNPEDFMKGRNQ